MKIKAPTKIIKFYLADADGAHCAVGHMLHELGIPDSKLHHMATFRGGDAEFHALAKQVLGDFPYQKLIRENDSIYGTDEERAQHFIKFAKQHGIEFTNDTL